MANSYFSRTYIDHGYEKSNVRFSIREMSAATIAALLTEAAALGTAIDDLQLGTLQKSELIQDSSIFGAAAPVDVNAQRERKWLVTYEDATTHKLYQLEIPNADLGNDNLLPNTDLADLTSTAWAAFVTAFETTARAPNTGNAVTVLRAQHVGRKG